MFFYCILFFVLIIILLSFSKIKIDISNIKISSEKMNGRYVNKNYKVTISLYIISKIKIFKINITKTKLEKIKVKDLEVKLIKIRDDYDKDTLLSMKKIRAKIEYLDLKLDIGTEDAVLTSYIVAIVSSLIGILLKNQLSSSESKRFIITPLYINKNLLNLELDCIFTVKMIHIIYIIYILKKKRRDDKHVRASNRRAYGYSYE